MPYMVVRPLKLRLNFEIHEDVLDVNTLTSWASWGGQGPIIIIAKYLFWRYSTRWLRALAPPKCLVRSDGPALVHSDNSQACFDGQPSLWDCFPSGQGRRRGDTFSALVNLCRLDVRIYLNHPQGNVD